jgi:alkylation response protein AidB-like acyl-CoA dehydrogenase
VIDGAKQFITNAGTDISATSRSPPHRRRRDLQPDRRERHAGLRAGRAVPQDGLERLDTRPLTFEDCRVPEENLLGPRGQGFKQFLHILDIGRIGVAAMGVGLAQGALDEALAYAKERKAFGKPISKFQAIQAKLADMATEIEAGPAARPTRPRSSRTRAQLHADRRAGEAQDRPLAVPRDRGGRADPRRLRLHRGVPGVPLLPRREDPHDRRGHRRGPADGDRPRAGRRE